MNTSFAYAKCYMFWSKKDFMLNRHFLDSIKNSKNQKTQLDRIISIEKMIFSNECRMKFILKYFDEDFDLCKKCDNCIANKDKGLLSFKTKRNLVTNSSEFYNLSYEYINDCLRAGLVYRREFYRDSELEPEDSLMFKITLVPFGNLNTPSF